MSDIDFTDRQKVLVLCWNHETQKDEYMQGVFLHYTNSFDNKRRANVMIAYPKYGWRQVDGIAVMNIKPQKK